MTEHDDDYMTDFQVLRIGLMTASVCTAHDVDETTRKLNLVHPTGLSWEWSPAKDPMFASGQTNPCKCEKRPDTHMHRLYVC